MRRLSLVAISSVFIVMAIAVAAPAAAQQSVAPPAIPAPPTFDQGQQPPPPAVPTQAPRPGTSPTAPPPPPQQPPTPPRAPDPAQMVNIRVELTITEIHGSNAPIKKTVFLITRSNSSARVRSNMVRPPDNASMGLNIDARPSVEKDGRIDLMVTFQYSPDPQGGTPEVTRPADLNETMEVFLTDGKPLLISQSANPKGDRRVTVEVMATIVK